mgnify:FL=1
MKKLIPLLIGALTLQLSAAAHSNNVMAVVKSKKGTTTIQSFKSEGSTFRVSELYAWKDGKIIDLLAPASAGAPTLEVKPGYCAITASEEHFRGSKLRVWGPGTHDVKGKTGSGIHSLGVYWNGNKPCQPEYDWPLLLTDDRKNYVPIFEMSLNYHFHSNVFTNKYNGSEVKDAFLWYEFNLADSIYATSSKIYFNHDIYGFSHVAKRLTVPSCHEVMVEDLKLNTYKFYEAGDHVLKTDFPSNVGYVSLLMNSASNDCKKPSAIERSAKGAVIRHNGNNLCLNPEGGGVPTYDTRAVLTSNCSATDPGNKFRRLFDGTIQHVESGMCLHPRGGSSTPGNGTELVFWPACGAKSGRNGAYIRFENTLKDSLRQLSSGMCLHPNGGSATPANGTKVVFWQGCNEDRLRFTFDAQ